MGELTAKKDQSLSGWDIRFLVPLWPEPEPDIRYIPNFFLTSTKLSYVKLRWVYNPVFSKPFGLTQPGHPSVERCSEYWRWFRPPLEKNGKLCVAT